MSSLPMAVGGKSAIFRYPTLCQCASDSFGAPPLNEGYLPESPQNSSSRAPLIFRTFQWRHMATFTVPVSSQVLGRSVLIMEQLPTKPARLTLSHKTSPIALDKTLEAQDIVGTSAVLCCKPTNLLDAIRFSKGFTIVEEEFVMEGVARLAGAPHTPGRYLQHLPKSLQSLTFDDSFDQNLEGVNLPHCLQSLTFGRWFNQLLAEMKLPNSLQSLAFGVLFNHSLEAVN